MGSTDQPDEEEKGCPHGMEKFNRMAKLCDECRFGEYRCPEGLKNREEKVNESTKG